MNPDQDSNRRGITYPPFSYNHSQPSQNMSTMNHQSTIFGRQVPHEHQYPALANNTTTPYHHLQPLRNRQPPSYLEPQVMINENAFHPTNPFDENNLPHPQNGQSYHQFDHSNHFQVPGPFSRIGQVSHAMNQTLSTPIDDNRTNPSQMNYGHSSMNQSTNLNDPRYPSPALQANNSSPYQYSATFYEPENGSHSLIADTDTPFGDSFNSNSIITYQTPGLHQDRIPRSVTPDPQTSQRLSQNGDTSGLNMLSTVTTPSGIVANNNHQSPVPASQMSLAIISRPQRRPKNPNSQLQKKLAEIDSPVGDNRQIMGQFNRVNAAYGTYKEQNSKKQGRRACYHHEVRAELIALDAAQHPPYIEAPAAGLDALDVTSQNRYCAHWTSDARSVRDKKGRLVLTMDDEPEEFQTPKFTNMIYHHPLHGGLIVLDHNNHPVRHWRDVPRVMSSEIEAWRIEALQRTIGIAIADIRARMPRVCVNKSGTLYNVQGSTALTNRTARWRKRQGVKAWRRNGRRKQAK